MKVQKNMKSYNLNLSNEHYIAELLSAYAGRLQHKERASLQRSNLLSTLTLTAWINLLLFIQTKSKQQYDSTPLHSYIEILLKLIFSCDDVTVSKIIVHDVP